MYGQKNYSQILGEDQVVSGRTYHPVYRIDQIGCFLTAFCNLLSRYGEGLDPVALNAYFRDHDDYLDIGDPAKDGLAWSSVSSYDGTISAHVNNNAGGAWPDTNDAIVKFHYQSISNPWLDAGRTRPNMIDHFCLVADHNAGTIVDSWDGVTKRPGAYGNPVAYATYTKANAQAQPAVAAPPYWVENITPKQIITSKQPTTKWGMNYNNFTAMNANPIATVAQGTIMTVVAIVHHAIGYTYYKTDVNDPDGWNTLDCPDYTAPAPAPAPAPEPAAPAKPFASDETPTNDDFKSTYVEEPGRFVAQKQISVQDFEGLNPVLPLAPGKVNMQGYFFVGGVKYWRSHHHAEIGEWYGVPDSNLVPLKDGTVVPPVQNDADGDSMIEDALKDMHYLDVKLGDELKEYASNITGRKRLVAIVASLIGFVERLKFWKK
jgi:hypothetical protein